eukprot:COSAG06_NODE_55138_length_291_cov_0.677083_1_plen_53_part_10
MGAGASAEHKDDVRSRVKAAAREQDGGGPLVAACGCNATRAISPTQWRRKVTA